MKGYTLYVIIGFLAFAMLFIFIFIILIIISWNVQTAPKSTMMLSHIFRVSGVALLILGTVMYQPFVTVILKSFSCLTSQGNNDEYKCFGVIHIVLMAASIVIGVPLYLVNLVSVALFIDDQPIPKVPWESCCVFLTFFKDFRKFVVSFSLFATDGDFTVVIVVSIACFVIGCICLYALPTQIRMKDKKVYFVLVISECFTTWFSFIVLFYMITNLNLGNPFALIVLSGGLLFVVLLWNNSHFSKMLLNKNILSFTDPNEIEMYSGILLEMHVNSKNKSGLILEGIFTMHLLSCKDTGCPCKDIEVENKEESKDQPYDSAVSDSAQSPNSSPRPKEAKKAIRSWNTTHNENHKAGITTENTDPHKKQQVALIRMIILEIEKWNKEKERNERLHIYLGYLKLEFIDNLMASLYEQMCAEEINSSWYEQYHAYRLRRRIEEKIGYKYNREQASSDMNNLVSFQKILADMQEDMHNVLKMFVGFWKELQNESPNFQYLGNTSHEITQSAIKIKTDYDSLTSLNQTNIYCRMLYALFLRKVMKDELEAYDISEKTREAHRNERMQRNYNSKQNTNGKTSLFIISGNKGNLGEILCINNEVTDSLGYEKHEIIGRNISMVMPPSIGKKHSEIMIKYFATSNSVEDVNKLTLPLHKYGYIVPCTLAHRVVPNLQQGVQLLGFLEDIKDFGVYTSLPEPNITPEGLAILLVDENYMLHAFNLKASKMFGINPSSANLKKYVNSEDQISVKKLFPDLEHEPFIIDAKRNGSGEIVINPVLMRKYIETEIEVSTRSFQENFESAMTPISPITEGDKSRSYSELTFKGNVSFIDLQCGKYSTNHAVVSLQLIIIYSEILSREEKGDKAQEKAVDKVFDDSKKKDTYLIDDNASQSSTSSASAAEVQEKNVRAFKDNVKQQRSPFFVRCFLKLGIIVFLMILASAILEHVLMSMNATFVSNSFKNTQAIHQRFNFLLNVPQSFRTINNIYEHYEANQYELYTDRVATYVGLISDELEKLRSLSIQIDEMKHPFTKEHKDLLNTPLVQLKEIADPTSTSQQPFISNYTFIVAITKYIARGTDLKSFDLSTLRNRNVSVSSDTSNRLSRLMNFIIENAKGSLAEIALKCKYIAYDEITYEVDKQKSSIIIVLITDPIVILTLMIIFVPFILKVQSSLLKIYLHLCKFKESDIASWIDECNNSISDIKASFKTIKDLYAKQKFEISALEEHKEKPEQRKRTTSTTEKGDTATEKTLMANQETRITSAMKPTENGNTTKNDDEETELMIAKEVAAAERKQEMFSNMTREKTKVYLIYLLLFALYLGIFKAVDAVLFVDFYSSIYTYMDVTKLLADREHNVLFSLLFFRENLRLHKIHSFYKYNDATRSFANNSFNSEEDTAKLRSILFGNLEDLRSLFNIIDTQNYCSGYLPYDNCSHLLFSQ